MKKILIYLSLMILIFVTCKPGNTYYPPITGFSYIDTFKNFKLDSFKIFIKDYTDTLNKNLIELNKINHVKIASSDEAFYIFKAGGGKTISDNSLTKSSPNIYYYKDSIYFNEIKTNKIFAFVIIIPTHYRSFAKVVKQDFNLSEISNSVNNEYIYKDQIINTVYPTKLLTLYIQKNRIIDTLNILGTSYEDRPHTGAYAGYSGYIFKNKNEYKPFKFGY